VQNNHLVIKGAVVSSAAWLF